MNTLVFLAVVGIGVATAQVTTGRCGDSVVPRIIGGQDILRCTWPFTPLVSIKLYYNETTGSSPTSGNLVICGGAVLNDQYILTTATCAAPLYGADTTVRASTRVLVDDNINEEVIGIEDVKIHPGYNDITTDHNIALLKLQTNIRAGLYGNCKRPACLLPQQTSSTPRCDTPDVDDTCIMASVGILSVDTLETAKVPQQATVKMFSKTVTDTILKAAPGNVIPEGAVLGQSSNSTRTCLFDWGGIVVCFNNGRYWLRGLIGTNNCLLPGSPSDRAPPIFITEVSNYRQWIDDCVANFNFCDTLPFQ